jgi:hypothetical protein
MKIPPKPAAFTPEGSVPGVEIKNITFLSDRPLLKVSPRLLLVHTNAASVEGTVESAWNHTHANPNENTCPHYQVDRTHNGATRARKMLPTNRRSIANATVKEFEGGHGDVSWFSISIETADLGFPSKANGFKAPGGTIGFDPQQGELIAQIIAYESIVHGFSIETPKEWFGSGVGCHTEPFGFPHWTLFKGKECPGAQKKLDMRTWIMPRANEIKSAWLGAKQTAPAKKAVGAPPKSTYTVVAGDGWFAIARKLGVPVKDLLAANGATKETMIHPGNVLRVPAVAA